MAVKYEADFEAWLEEQRTLLRQRKFDQLDMKNLLEEIEDLGNSTKNAIVSFIVVIIKHMLKIQYQSDRHGKSWDDSINDARTQVRSLLEDNPSLKNFPQEAIRKAYPRALKEASREMKKDLYHMNSHCVWTVKEILGD